MEIQTRARYELDHIIVRYPDMTMEQVIDMVSSMHNLAIKRKLFMPDDIG